MLNNNNSITQTVIMNDVLEMLPRQRNYILRLYPDPENIPVVEQTINTIGRSMSDGNGYLARRQSRLLEATENDLSQVIQPYSEDTLNNPSSVINSFLADLHNPRTFNLPEIDTTAAVDASEILLSFSNNMRENINNTNFQESIRRLTSNVLSHRQRFITELSEAYHNNNIGDYIRHRVNQDTDILNNIFDLFQTGLLENLFTVTNHVLNSGHNKAVILALILAFTKVFLRLGIFRFVFTYPAHMLVDLVRKIIDEILRSRIMRTSVNTFRNASQAGSAAEIREYSQRVLPNLNDAPTSVGDALMRSFNSIIDLRSYRGLFTALGGVLAAVGVTYGVYSTITAPNPILPSPTIIVPPSPVIPNRPNFDSGAWPFIFGSLAERFLNILKKFRR